MSGYSAAFHRFCACDLHTDDMTGAITGNKEQMKPLDSKWLKTEVTVHCQGPMSRSIQLPY